MQYTSSGLYGGIPYDHTQIQQPAYSSYPAERSTRNDGLWAAFLVGSILLGPTIIVSSSLPPLRFADVIVLLMLLFRWGKSQRLYGGMFFSSRIRILTIFMLTIVVTMLVSMALGVATGYSQLYHRDLFYPIVFIRMIVIAAIAATFYFDERQVKHFFFGLLLLSIISVLLAFGQKYRFFGIGSTFNNLYAISERISDTFTSGFSMQITRTRVVGTTGNANVFGGTLVMLAVFMISYTIHMRGSIRLIAAIAFCALGLTQLLTTGSRTGLLAFILITAVTLVVSLRPQTWLPTLLIGFLIGVLFFMLRNMLYDMDVNPRVLEMLGGQQDILSEGVHTRHFLWAEGIKEGMQSPLLGVGPTKQFVQLTDNGYINMFQRMGIIGLTIYVTMLLSFVWRGFKGMRKAWGPTQRAITTGLFLLPITHIIYEITGDFLWNIRYGALVMCFLGLMCGVSNQVQQESSLRLRQNTYDKNNSEHNARHTFNGTK